VLSRTKRARINASRMQNVLTTTAIRKVGICHHSKYYMDASAKHHCFGMNSEKTVIEPPKGGVRRQDQLE
jgi:hypothetical protein